MKRRHGINTSHQPDPNKIAAAAAAAAAEAAGVTVNNTSLVSATMATHSIYVNQGSNPGHETDQHIMNRGDRGVQFYNSAPTPYVAAPIPTGTMLGFYNIPQLQQGMDTSAMEMLHSVQQR